MKNALIERIMPVEEENAENIPETIFWVSDERVELGRCWEGYAFRNVEAFRTAMEAVKARAEAEGYTMSEWIKRLIEKTLTTPKS